MHPLRTALLAILCQFVTSATAEQVALPALTGRVILTVSGLNDTTWPGGQVLFDLNRLATMDQSVIVTSSVWTTGPHVYSGVMLQTLTQFLGIDKGVLRLHALNDYAIDLPLRETWPQGPILALRMDGALMSVRSKGPIWVVYPYDSDLRFRTDEVFARSVWQLDEIRLLH